MVSQSGVAKHMLKPLMGVINDVFDPGERLGFTVMVMSFVTYVMSASVFQYYEGDTSIIINIVIWTSFILSVCYLIIMLTYQERF